MTTVDAIARHLAQDGAVLLPTETVWGLAARADSADGVAAIYALKGRDDGKPLAVCVSGRAQAQTLAEVPPAAARLMDAHWPGPLTLVLPVLRDADLHPQCTDGGRTVGLRCPDTHWRDALCTRPLALTSANRSGAPAASTQAEAERAFPGTPLLPDPDPDASGLPTTIVRVDGDRTTVLRQGGLSL